MPNKTAQSAEYPDTLAAVQAMQAGADQWVLADALLKEVGVGEPRVKFHAVNEALSRAGLKPKHIDSLRFARDTAAAWPVHTRFVGVSFTAHRELRFFDDREAILRALVAQYGLKVSVSIVNAELVARGLSKRTTNMSSQVAVVTVDTPPKASSTAGKQAVDIAAVLKGAQPEELLQAYYEHYLVAAAAETKTHVLSTLGSPTGRTLVNTVARHLESVQEQWRKADAVTQRMASKAPKSDAPKKREPVSAKAQTGTPKKRRVGDMRGLG